MGALWMGGAGDCGTVSFGGGGNTYPWPKATIATHKKIDTTATRIFTLLDRLNCSGRQHCMRNWMEPKP